MSAPVVGIVGDRGRMGSMLVRELRSAGYIVQGGDLPLTPEVLTQICAGAGVVILCVPAAAMEEVTQTLAPYVAPGTVLVDITSVKMLPLRAMEKNYAGPVVGTHPLFGPRPRPGYNAVCITPGGQAGEASVAAVEALFMAMGCTTFRSTAERHDRAMAAIQGLNFITSVAYFAMLSQRDDVLPFLTPSLQRRMDAARTMLTSDAELFTGIFGANPLSQEAVREYRSYLNLAAGGDVDVLVALASRWFRESTPTGTSYDRTGEKSDVSPS